MRRVLRGFLITERLFVSPVAPHVTSAAGRDCLWFDGRLLHQMERPLTGNGYVGGTGTILFFVLLLGLAAYFLLRFSFKGSTANRP